MITHYRLQNFKIHESTKLDMNPITILTGKNGSGKSSIIQSLLLLRQADFVGGTTLAGLNLKGDLCELGTSDELASQYSKSDCLTIEIAFDGNDASSYDFCYPDDAFQTYMPLRNDQINSGLTFDTKNLSLFNDNFQYISAFRFGPMNIYHRDTNLVNNHGQISKQQGQCEYTIHFLNDFAKEEILHGLSYSGTEKEKYPDYSLLAQTQLWLKEVSEGIEIEIKKIDADFRLAYRYQRSVGQDTDEIAAINTGFGITYVLPIIVAILSAKKDSLIIIENPEAHIHPQGQAALMRLIAKAAKEGIQVIIETHSDHIINGALVSVANKQISTDDLSIYYFERNEKKHSSESHHLEVSERGTIHNAPDGFFDQIDIDMQTIMGF